MANEEHLKIIRQGVDEWNEWRKKNPELIPDLSLADLRGANLHEANVNGAQLNGANLIGADLSGANLNEAKVNGANLNRANLRGANLSGANLHKANLSGAKLDGAELWRANLNRVDLRGADLSGAKLGAAQLIRTDLCDAVLTGSFVHGVSVWDIKVNERTKQQNLIITPRDSAAITVDNIEVAQFIYLLLNNQKLRDVIDTITSKAVLILGRFSEERKPVLDAIRDELRKRDYLPIIFDFPPSVHQTVTETVTTLARMARFVIADLTDARSVLQELEAIVPDLPSVAVF